MTIEKILNYLKKLFEEEIPNKKFHDNMIKILSKLEERQLMLAVQLDDEKNEEKIQDINLRLKIISKQIKKGQRLIQKRCSFPTRKGKVIKPKLSINASQHAI